MASGNRITWKIESEGPSAGVVQMLEVKDQRSLIFGTCTYSKVHGSNRAYLEDRDAF